MIQFLRLCESSTSAEVYGSACFSSYLQKLNSPLCNTVSLKLIMSDLSCTDSITIRNNYDVACPMNFRKYPYDTQICKVKYESCEFSHDSYPIRISFILDGYTTKKMSLKWKKGFDQSKVKMISQRYLKTYETKI